MKIVAFLQNAWFFPETDPRVINRYQNDHDFRIRVLAMSHTGRLLIKGLGDDFYRQIRWEESSKESGEVSSSKFAADHQHIQSVIAEQQPTAILAFGKLAEESVGPIWSSHFLAFPHPAMRSMTDQLITGVGKMVALFWLTFQTAPVPGIDPVRFAFRVRGGCLVKEKFPWPVPGFSPTGKSTRKVRLMTSKSDIPTAT